MQLPAWVHSGSEVCYVYEEDGRREMEVYSVSPDTFERLRVVKYNLKRYWSTQSAWRKKP